MDQQSAPDTLLLVLLLTTAGHRRRTASIGWPAWFRVAPCLTALLLSGGALAGADDLAAQEIEAPPGEAPALPGARADADPHRRELAARLDRLLADPSLARAHAGLVVLSAAGGEVLYERAAERRFTAASASKLVTGAVALHRLGAGFRWRTRLLSAEAPEDGLLPGDLWIVGGGDPALGADVLARWAGELRRAGVARIAGDLIGDDRIFDEPPWGRGWMWEDLYAGWGAGVSGLSLSPGRTRAELVPSASVGEPATLAFAEGESPVPVLHDVRTGPPGSEARLRWLPPTEGGAVRLEGWIPVDRSRVPISLAPLDPTEHLLSRLEAVLVDSAIAVHGRVRRPRAEEAPPHPAGFALESTSDSLGAVLVRMLKESDNRMAEALLRTLGRAAGERGSAEAGIATVEEVLATWGIGPDAVSLADGSGLSRYNEAAPMAIARLLRRVLQLPIGPAFESALPVAAVDGTLSGRLGGTAAARRLRAKTGSLSGVRALAGTVPDARGGTLIFVLMLNGYHAADAVARGLEDLLVEQLAGFRGADYPPGTGGAESQPGTGGAEPRP